MFFIAIVCIYTHAITSCVQPQTKYRDKGEMKYGSFISKYDSMTSTVS